MRLRERLMKLPAPPRLLVVTAVAAEREALRRGTVHSGFVLTLIEGGVGPARAAASAASAIARADERGEPFLAVLSAGIAGGFAPTKPGEPGTGPGEPSAGPGEPGTRPDEPGARPGDIVIGRASVAADLGAQTADGFLSIDELGFGTSTVECDADLVALLREALPGSAVGTVLTVSTVTGTAERAAALQSRYPDAVAEAMEGFGVATAAVQAGLPFAEVRTISNQVGPRDRGAWRIPDALAALERVGRALANLEP